MKKFLKVIGVLVCVLLLSSNIAYADAPLVVLDAGHGGSDSGAISLDGQYLEKVWNLQTTKSCKETLEKYGVEVIMTREDDIFLSLAERKQIANSADVSISIHYNATANHKGAYGLVIGGKVEGSTKLAHSIKDELLKVRDNVQVWENNSYYAMTNLKVPAVIVETAFIDNPNDNKYADTLEEREEIGKRIAYGILNYLDIDTTEVIEPTKETDKSTEDNSKKKEVEVKEDKGKISIADKIRNLILGKRSSSDEKIQYIKDLILK